MNGPDALQTPLFSLRGAGWALFLSVLLCWPILVTGADFIFADSESYLHGGYRIWAYVLSVASELLQGAGSASPTGAVAGAHDLTQGESGVPSVGRSFVYSAFAAALHAGPGTLGLAIFQGWIVVMAMFALIGPGVLAKPANLAVGATVLVLLSSLPWYTVYLMPDVLASVPILFAAALLTSFDRMTSGQKIALTALAAFAAASHYGTGLLTLGIVGFAALWRIAARRWSAPALIAALVAVSAAPIANLTASTAVLKEPSMAPQRLPILLARSIDDGPALWYLRDVCPDASWAVCRIFGTEIPDNAGTFLWTKNGINDLGPGDMAAIRREELPLLGRVFLAYPLAQSEALFGNAARQLFLIGTDDIRAVDRIALRDDPQPATRSAAGRALLEVADLVVVWSTGGAAILLAGLLATGRIDARQRQILITALVGLVCNALIFGGLSAPVERYQSRVAWLIPFLACLFLLQRNARRPAGTAPAGGPQE